MIKPTKKYILWIKNDGSGYVPTEFDSFEELLLIEKYTSDWYATESINDISGYGRFEKVKE